MAGLGALWSHCQRETVVLSRKPAREHSGHLCTRVTGLEVLEGRESGKRGNPNNFSPSLFFFLTKLYWQEIWHSF